MFETREERPDGEMYEIKVEIVQPEILQTPPAGGLHMVGVMESVPQLGGHEQLLSAADPGLYGLPDTSANLGIHELQHCSVSR